LDDPGELLSTFLRPHPSGKAPRACFEYEVLPERPFLQWCIEHPEELSWPRREDFKANTRRLRRAPLYDEPPGRENAQAQALELLETRAVSERGWWRFEGSSFIDCVLATDRLVVTVEGKRTEPLSAATDWYPQRSQIVRNLEAARQIAKGRRWATVVISETEHSKSVSRWSTSCLEAGERIGTSLLSKHITTMSLNRAPGTRKWNKIEHRLVGFIGPQLASQTARLA